MYTETDGGTNKANGAMAGAKMTVSIKSRLRRGPGCHPSRGGGRLTGTNEVRFDPTPAIAADPTFIRNLCSQQE